MYAIQVDGLTKRYGRGARASVALDGLSLSVEPGRIYGLLGANGAGKTTLVKVLLGLRRATEGTASLLGRPIGDVRVRREVGYLPEDHRLPPYLTGHQALRIYGSLQGLSKAEIRSRGGELLERLDLAGRAGQKIRAWSKGMKQRLGLAQALLGRPRLLFLDEPTDGVDPVGRKVIREIIEEAARGGTTVFLNSHLLMEVERICHRIAILDRGRKVCEGAVEDLVRPSNEFEFDLAGGPGDPADTLAGLPGVSAEASDGGWLVRVDREESIDAVIDRLRAAGHGIRGMTRRKQSLEDYFLQTLEEAAT